MEAKTIRIMKIPQIPIVLYVSMIVLFFISIPFYAWPVENGEIETLNVELKSVVAPNGDENMGNASELKEIKLTFKLDQRLTRSMYMGDRWVSPTTYTKVQAGGKLVVEARAQGVDKWGRQIEIAPEWETNDPCMVTIRPETGKQVTLTIHKEGQGYVTVKEKGISRKLTLKSRPYKDILLVEITHQAE